MTLHPHAWSQSSCCERECLKCIDEDFVKKAREHFWSRTLENRIEWFYDKIMEMTPADKPKDRIWSAGSGHKVCSKSCRHIFGIDKKFFYHHIKKFDLGAIAAGSSRLQMSSDVKNNAITWLQDYAQDYGDRMPHTPDILLPYNTQIKDVWKKYCEDMESKLEEKLACTTFRKMWKTNFPHMKVKKVRF